MRRTARPVKRALLLALSAAAFACKGSPTDASSIQPPARVAYGPEWTKGAVCYEIFVRSFADSDGDGIGDLNGLIAKLDYINDGVTSAGAEPDLGARCIWLMPVMPSPSYHGYDVTDYYHVNPQYGTDADFKRLVTEAHRRGIRVLVDMVLNHTSSDHPAFKAALADPASPFRDWYRFSPTPLQTAGPWGQEVWHRSPVRDEYYYGVFWVGMPDLDLSKPPARDEAKKIATYWLNDMGADGFRLDAVPYFIEEGDRLRDTPSTHAFLREYGAYVRQAKADSWTVGEVWDAVDLLLSYYPDQLDSNFAFALSDALIAAVSTGSARDLLTGWMQVQRQLPGNRYSPFQRNHDQTRTLTALGGDVARARVAATLLLTLPGLPYVYYGEEIGMTGDKPDERIRTPMQWSSAPNAGFTTGTPWEPLQGDWSRTNVQAQDADSTSLLNLYRRLIHLRSANSALAMGELVPLATGNDAVAAYLRRDANRAVLVVANLGAGPLAGLALTAAVGALPRGDYAARPLVGGVAGAALHVGSDGAFSGYVPLATLAPMQAYVFDLVTGH